MAKDRRISPLRGRHVLVLEDDFYQALELAEVLASAGARIVGPFHRADAALDAIANETLAAAVLNIGLHPSFEVARLLKEQSVPFVFLSAHDRSILPPDLANMDVLQKPIVPRKLIAMIEQLQH
jgi:DNA-binding response OmpR family regulator